jgi:hypothetical protein
LQCLPQHSPFWVESDRIAESFGQSCCLEN